MRTGFDNYKNGDAKAKKLYEAAFGKNADADKINTHISMLQTATVSAKVATHTFTGDMKDAHASIKWTGNPKTPSEIRFSKGFHGSSEFLLIVYDSSHG